MDNREERRLAKIECIAANDKKVRTEATAAFAALYEKVAERVGTERLNYTGNSLLIGNRYAMIRLAYNTNPNRYNLPLKAGCGRLVLEAIGSMKKGVRIGVTEKNLDRVVAYVEEALVLEDVANALKDKTYIARETLISFLILNDLEPTIRPGYKSAAVGADYYIYESTTPKGKTVVRVDVYEPYTVCVEKVVTVTAKYSCDEEIDI